jgi:hypothetical protein
MILQLLEEIDEKDKGLVLVGSSSFWAAFNFNLTILWWR